MQIKHTVVSCVLFKLC